MTTTGAFWLAVFMVCLITSVIGTILAECILMMFFGGGGEERRLEDQIDRLYDLAEKRSFERWQK